MGYLATSLYGGWYWVIYPYTTQRKMQLQIHLPFNTYYKQTTSASSQPTDEKYSTEKNNREFDIKIVLRTTASIFLDNVCTLVWPLIISCPLSSRQLVQLTMLVLFMNHPTKWIKLLSDMHLDPISSSYSYLLLSFIMFKALTPEFYFEEFLLDQLKSSYVYSMFLRILIT